MAKIKKDNLNVTGEEMLNSPAPHIHSKWSVKRTMYLVILALMFPTAASIYFFGLNAILVILTSVLAAVATEYLIKLVRKKKFVMDGSAVITGLLLALTLPPTLPLWIAALGSIFAIAIVKEAFGGLGHNIFNPALAGRAFIQLSFPAPMSVWIAPSGFAPDAVTSASPLSDAFKQIGDNFELYMDLLLGNTSGSLGETSALLLLAGGIFLIILRIIDWRTPLAFIGTMAILSLVLGQDAVYQVLSGGLMIGAFFMATDYVTAPLTRTGKIIFGAGAGVLTIVIRLWGGMPEGVCYAILLMNAAAPLIDRYTQPKPYGLKKK
ncbi:MAG: RnfABCDGE type electron transport complex subunit D [Dehalococcoidales bacterium]|nr:RnfABCDGE type electron transport complex subunit D [Dehalococcoidales bacterium]